MVEEAGDSTRSGSRRLAGHGQKDADDNFFFIPYDYESGDNEEGLAYSGVAWDDLLRPLANMPCPVVLVMDACHSGTITLVHYRGPVRKEHLRDELNRAAKGSRTDSPRGLVVMAASLARQAPSSHQSGGTER